MPFGASERSGVSWALAGIGVGIRLTWMHAPSGLVAAVYLLAG